MRISPDSSDAEAALSLLIETMGEERILFGTDYPFPLGEATPGKLIAKHDGDLAALGFGWVGFRGSGRDRLLSARTDFGSRSPVAGPN